MDAEANKTLVLRYIEMWNTGNVALADEILALTWRDHNHPEVTGLESVKQVVLATRTAFPDFHITVESIVGEGDRVALRAMIQRTQRGNISVSRVMWFVRLADRKMTELWTGIEASG